MDVPVLLAFDQVAERVTDRRRREETTHQLVEERLEGVVVVAVDEHDLGVRILQLLRCADSGKASSEDEDAWTRAGGRDAVT